MLESFALAAFDTNSIALGFLLADEALKTADITMRRAGPVCAGRFIAVFTGTAAAVRAAVEAARARREPRFHWSDLYIASCHEDLAAALCGKSRAFFGSLGVFEAMSAIGALELGDEVAKRWGVRLLDLRLGQGLGGKSTLLFCGEQAAVESAVAMLGEPAGAMTSDVLLLPDPDPRAVLAFACLAPDRGCPGAESLDGASSTSCPCNGGSAK